MVKVPISVQREIELVFKRKRRSKKEPLQISREELVQKALAIVDLMNKIAQTEPVRLYLYLTDIKIFDHNPWNIVLACLGATPGCYSRLDIDGHPEGKNDYVEMKNRDSFQFWSVGELGRFSQLTEKQIWKIILEWIQYHRERI